MKRASYTFDEIDERILFATLALGTAAEKRGIKPSELKRRLDNVGLMTSYVYARYNTLHTQSAEYVGEAINEALSKREQMKGISKQ